jgi:hypothetical protein
MSRQGVAVVLTLLGFACGLAGADEVVLPAVAPQKEANLLLNGGFEEGVEPWTGWKQGFERSAGPGAHSGTSCVRLTSHDPALEYGVCQQFALKQAEPALVIVEAWSRSEMVDGGADAGYSLYVDVAYADGSHLWQQTAPFPVGTHEWVRREVTVMPEKPIAALAIYGLLRGHTGTAYFDDFAVYVPARGGMFDGTPISPVTERRNVAAKRTCALRTADGLVLTLDDTGRVVELQANSPLTQPDLVAASGFLLRDVAVGSDFIRPLTTLTQEGGSARVSAASEALGLSLTAELKAIGPRIAVTGSLLDTTGRDRCVSVYFVLPLRLDQAVWWSDVDTARPLKSSLQAGTWSNVGAGSNGFMSTYPWTAISMAGDGVSLCVPMDRPQLVRMGVAKGLTYIVFDLGLSAKTTRNPSRADFEFGLYQHDPAWGFRAAAQRYYEIFPDCFTKRVKSEGIWLITKGVQKIANPEDFHFKFLETGARKYPVEVALGIESYRYSEPWRWRQRYEGKGQAEERTVEGSLAILEKRLTSADAAVRRASWAAKGAVCHDDLGKPLVYIEDAPWGTSALFVCNADPNLPLSGPDPINQAYCSYSPALAKERYGSGVEPEQDGEYIDSVEGFAWPRVCNYRAEHFASTEAPLTFGTSTRRICILNAFSHYAFLRYTGTDLHQRGKLMFGNALPETFYFFVPSFDILGTEHGWISRDGAWRPEAESRSNYRRALCYRKPYLMLLNTDFNKMSYANVEKYMRRCAFFGFFPSMFSADAFHDRYFDDPKYYDRDRPLFKTYIPVILAMSQAGWCPITHARCPEAAIRLERFGEGATVYLSVLNTDKEKPRRAVLSLDRVAMGLGEGAIVASEVFSGQAIPCADGTVSLDLAADDVAVVRLQRQ